MAAQPQDAQPNGRDRRAYHVTRDGQVVVTAESLRKRVLRYRGVTKKLVEAHKALARERATKPRG